MAVQRLATRLTAVGERHLRSNHPWIYDRAIERIKGDGKAGDLSVIFDRKKDKFIGIGLYDPDSPIRIKVLHQGSPVRIDESFWTNEVAKAKSLRTTLLSETDTNSYRLINGENDGFPGLIVDVYAQVMVIKVYSLIWAPHLDIILPLLINATEVQTVVLRLSRRVETAINKPANWKDGAILHGELESEEVIFREHGIKLKANVLKGHKTGFFLDHRYNRKRVGELASKARVLDVFSYAGGFSVHALAGGAEEVTALDISEQALSVARENVALNGFGENFQTLAGDAFEFMGKLAGRKMHYDLVIIDPPSFAKSEKEVAGALKAYERLTKLGIQLVEAGGTLLLASCSARVKAEDFFALQESILNASERRWEEVERSQHDVDHPVSFPEGSYLKSMYIRFF